MLEHDKDDEENKIAPFHVNSKDIDDRALFRTVKILGMLAD